MRGTFESAQSTQNGVSLFGTENVTLQNNANGGGGDVAAKGPITFIFSIFPLKKDPKKDPGGKVQ